MHESRPIYLNVLRMMMFMTTGEIGEVTVDGSGNELHHSRRVDLEGWTMTEGYPAFIKH